MKKYIRILLGLALVAACVLVLNPDLSAATDAAPVDFRRTTDRTAPEPVIEDGISINGISMGGMTKAEAEAQLEEYFGHIAEGELVIHSGALDYRTSYEDIGFEYDYEDELCQALILGQSVGTVKKFKALSDMRAGVMELYGKDHLNTTKLLLFVQSVAEKTYVEPVDAVLRRENDAFIVSPGRDGMEMDANATYELISSALENGVPESLIIDGAVEEIPQTVSYEMLSQVKDVLGTCSTEVGGNASRARNVAIGASNINGKLLMPGESASTSEMMKERIPENGYEMAPQYVDGTSQDAYGGGVCQVSSTLYNALLAAEIQIDERHNHSMLITYVDPSMDAAISWGTKDMRFTNNLEYPIYIEGHSENRICTFTIYGCETRPENRKVKYESHVTHKEMLPDIIRETNEFPVGYRSETGGTRHAETRSYMEKVVYINDVEVSREKINEDYYRGSVHTVIIGTAPVETVPAETTPAETTPAETAPAETKPAKKKK